MSDFMQWLYTHYIKPELDRTSQDGHALWVDGLENNLSTQARRDYDRALEFYAVHAFLLGVRTGRGLPL